MTLQTDSPPADEPVRLLIAALGGEGGGVLAGWITAAATASGCWAQRTSIPGVAQRTGATTYYVEVIARRGTVRPILALAPAPGLVDVMVATELVELARAIQSGYVTPERTLLIGSTHRVFTIAEKMAMADGRIDGAALYDIARRFSARMVLADMAAVAKEAGSLLNAVVLGVIAASGALPVPAEAFRQAIVAEGKAVASNLAGFEAGLRLAGAGGMAAAPAAAWAMPTGVPSTDDLEAAANQMLPAEARPVAIEGLRRLTDFQDTRYAALYLDRLARFVGLAGADGPLLRELARHLAVRMSYEDTIRVAQLKLRAARLTRVAAEARARPQDIVRITEYLKPGPEEILGVLPAGVARPLLRLVERRGWGGLAFPMRVHTTGLWGFGRMKVLALLRRWRPASLRNAEEQAWIERWLGLVQQVLARDSAAAGELIETAKLVRGYGDTYKRGAANWRRIAEAIVEPALADRLPGVVLADAVLQARVAALADPEGTSLAAVIAAIETSARPPRLAAE
jgi:indolepyruvate ferredoxin oxidoreductase beta subunit